MDRKDFLKRAAMGAAGVVVGHSASAKTNPSSAQSISSASSGVGQESLTPIVSTYDRLMEQVGFNHLPNTEVMTTQTVYHPANSRGHANHGWLNSHHSFSFANYRNPDRMHFGVLRVLNDDVVQGGKGFGAHPHDNMEIVSIPLDGDLEHQDSMGNKTVIRQGDVQVMSAGTGVRHSEYNASSSNPVKFLQIWMFPNKRNVEPRYDQIKLEAQDNAITQILSPSKDDAGVWAHQNAWWHVAKLDERNALTYALNKPGQNGVYAFVLEGNATIDGQALNPRDGFGIWDTNEIAIKATSNTRILLMEVPMELS
ncbi:MAG: pirin family protein [Saprospiraceae bacterium]